MDSDKIIRVEIDEEGRLHLKPLTQKFTLIYRTASEIHWDNDKQTLFSPKPKAWSYIDWAKHIVKIVRDECSCELSLSEEAEWFGVDGEIKNAIVAIF